MHNQEEEVMIAPENGAVVEEDKTTDEVEENTGTEAEETE